MPIEIEYRNNWAESQGLILTRVERGQDTTVQIDADNALEILWVRGGGIVEKTATLTFLNRCAPRTTPRGRLDAVRDFLRNLRLSFSSMIYIFEGRGFNLEVKKQVVGTVSYMPEGAD